MAHLRQPKENPGDHSFAVKLPLDLVIPEIFLGYDWGFRELEDFGLFVSGILSAHQYSIVSRNATNTMKLPLEVIATVKPNARGDPKSQNAISKANMCAELFQMLEDLAKMAALRSLEGIAWRIG